MAGHSQFKNIMHRKGAQDAKRAKLFTKFIREITAATRAGLPDPAQNPRLRAAVVAARAANMPKDTIERAIKRGAGAGEGEQFEEVRYEGYGPGGVAIIVDALTDNRNRTAGDIRSAFTKLGGTLGETNSVSFLFSRVGLVRYPVAAANADEIFEAASEAGAQDVDSGVEVHEILCNSDDLNAVRDALEKKFGTSEKAALSWRPLSTVEVEGEAAEKLFRLLETLDDNDDVQSISANYNVSEAVMTRLGN